MLSPVLISCAKKPKPKECKYIYGRYLQQTGDPGSVYFFEQDSNITHKKGSLNTNNAQKLWRRYQVVCDERDFYKGQLQRNDKSYKRLEKIRKTQNT